MRKVRYVEKYNLLVERQQIEPVQNPNRFNPG
jgi:hypothetical protein